MPWRSSLPPTSTYTDSTLCLAIITCSIRLAGMASLTQEELQQFSLEMDGRTRSFIIALDDDDVLEYDSAE